MWKVSPCDKNECFQLKEVDFLSTTIEYTFKKNLRKHRVLWKSNLLPKRKASILFLEIPSWGLAAYISA